MRHYVLAVFTSMLAIAALVAVMPGFANAQDAAESLSISAASPININTATESQLAELPGIGPAIAERIVRFRQKAGSFQSIDDLKQVKGIGEKTFLRIKDLVHTGPAS